MPKRIILLLDGTWNDADFGDTDTNIVRIRDLIAESLHVPPPPVQANPEGSPNSATGRKVTSVAFASMDNVVFYERGVGTGAFMDRWLGGALGEGVTSNIRHAYKFLSFHYQVGDEVFIFGFSRGAYTARSLVGYIHAAGLLRREKCTPELEQEAWDFYRCPPNDRLPGIWTALTPDMHDRDRLRISCLGVFDTVGALGVPLAPFRVLSRDQYEFHDVELSSITDVNLHALAVDEYREPFEATVWRRSKFKLFDTITEQVWFAGAHADIGGGYIKQERRNRKLFPSLDDITLDWMLGRILQHFPDFPIDKTIWRGIAEADRFRWAEADQHNPRRGLYSLFPRAVRSIGNVPVVGRDFPLIPAFREVNVSRDRHAVAQDEMLHISVLERLGKVVSVDGRKKQYAPKNVLALLDAIKSEYAPAPSESKFRVVNWSGEVITPNTEEAELVLKLLDAASRRLEGEE
jgi:hypothetical protein